METVGDRLRKAVDNTTAAAAAATGAAAAAFVDDDDLRKSHHDLKGKGKDRYDPEEYTHAKKKLKKAVLEHYRFWATVSVGMVSWSDRTGMRPFVAI